MLLLTTRMDVPWNAGREANDYWQTQGSSWFVVFPNLLAKYLAGDSVEAVFNFPTGVTVSVNLPPEGLGKAGVAVLEGPGLTTQDETYLRPAEKQTALPIGPPRTANPGNFTVSTEDRKWVDGFSLNVPAEEGVLDKVPVEVVEELTGKDTVVPMEKNVRLRDALQRKFTQPVDLFPWLLIAVLLLLAVEGLVANRFYRRAR